MRPAPCAPSTSARPSPWPAGSARRRDHGGVAFLDLRDASGMVQVVVHDPAVAHPLRNEFCVKVIGEVVARPEGNENPELPTGDIEVTVDQPRGALRALRPLPFPIDEHVEVGEEARLRYRYLDLRRPEPARIMRLRTQVNRIAREVLYERDFVEIETPTLTRSTPEGARDFLVPARLQPGSWYALPQSPQLFKQLLMVAGMERYFQIARCYRDEDFRADRQPEFTQLDVEMSFVEQDDVIEVGEAVIRALWAGTIGHEIAEFPRMTYAEAMAGSAPTSPTCASASSSSSSPTTSPTTPFRVFQAPYVGAVVMPGGGVAAAADVRCLAGVGQAARGRGPGLRHPRRGRRARRTGGQEHHRGRARRPGRRRPAPSRATASSSLPAPPPRPAHCWVLRAWRSADALRPDRPESRGRSCGSSTRPLFEAVVDDDGTAPAGRPCTTRSPRPTPSGSTGSSSRPGEALAYAYDMVCNGNEIGGGSIRIHRARRAAAGVRDAGHRRGRRPARSSASCSTPSPTARRRTAASRSAGTASSCCSPAPTRCARSSPSPRPAAGHDPLTGAPTPITAAQRKEAGIDARPEAGPAGTEAGPAAG